MKGSQFSIAPNPSLEVSFDKIRKNDINPGIFDEYSDFNATLFEVYQVAPETWFWVGQDCRDSFASAMWVLSLAGYAECQIDAENGSVRWSGWSKRQHEFVRSLADPHRIEAFRSNLSVAGARCPRTTDGFLQPNAWPSDAEGKRLMMRLTAVEVISDLKEKGSTYESHSQFLPSQPLTDLPTIRMNSEKIENHIKACIELMQLDFRESFGFTWSIASRTLALCFPEIKIRHGDGTLQSQCQRFISQNPKFSLPKFGPGKKPSFAGLPPSARKILKENGGVIPENFDELWQLQIQNDRRKPID